VRILVTGANGFAGLHLLSELSRGGHRITAGAFDPRGVDIREVPGVEWVALDVTSSESVRAAVEASEPEQVYHLAGQASVGESFRAPELTWEVNATGTLRVLEALRARGAPTRLLLTSSAEVYGSVGEGDQPISEGMPLRPVTPYGASKAAAEMLGIQYALAGLVEVVIARSFNHVGPGQDERFVLASFARQLARMRRGSEDPVLRVGNLDVFRDFLDVRDGVRGYVAMMEHGRSGDAYNVCSGSAVSLDEVVRTMVELSGTGASVEVDAGRVRPVDIRTLRGDSSRLRGLGWEPALPLSRSLRDLLAHAGEALVVDG
jgi:GDP-4-dehydro-6-deoxy-D-mannose reductase